MLDIYEYYQNMQNDNVVLAYKGNVSGDLFNCILQIAENKLDKIELRSKLKKKVFNILVEILQNIYHHFDDLKADNEEYYSVIFLLGKKGSEYNIITGNHISIDKVEALKNKLDTINAMSEDELKAVYRETLYNGGISEKGGAGLGIIDIVRKSGEKVNYEFRKVNDNFSFFSLQVKITA
jgi:hypothetical protein